MSWMGAKASGAASVSLATAAAALVSVVVVAAQSSGKEMHVAQRELPAVPHAQFRTIAEAARAAEPGDAVIIHGGVYREEVVIEKSGTERRPIRFVAATGERVVVSGADELTDLRREGAGPDNIYSCPWPHRFIGWNPHHTHPGNEQHRMVGRCEQVFVSEYPLLQVLSRDALSRGTFYVDLNAERLYLWSADNADLIKHRRIAQASARGALWVSKGAHIHVRGVRFRYAANMAQHGAARFEGDHNVIEDCVFEGMNSSGATFTGTHLIVRRCVFQDNGQLGFGANGAHHMLMTGCLVRNNNVKNFGRGWEAGGNKLAFCRGVAIEKSRFVGNRGHGVWFDIGNERCVVRNCLIADNEDGGIFYEISFSLHAHDNVIVGNGFAVSPGAWGAQAGISLSSSPECVIERNLLIGNKEGFNFREQMRTTPLIDDRTPHWVWNHDQVVRNNVIAYNRDAQAWGWFDVNDGRHWPRAMQGDEFGGGRPPEDVAAEYKAKGKEGAPAGLSLESLTLTFENNIYCAAPGQGLFNWGVTWKKHKRYASLDDVQKELGLERGSQDTAFVFEDFLTRDFRVPSSSPAMRAGCYPRGEVPGVVLGTTRAR